MSEPASRIRPTRTPGWSGWGRCRSIGRSFRSSGGSQRRLQTDRTRHRTSGYPAGVPFLSAEAVSDGRLDFGRRRGFISQEIHEMYCRKCRPQRDDIFMCKSGATTGKVAIVETDDEFSVWSPLALIRVDAQRVIAKLLFRVLQSRYLQGQVRDTWSFGTQPNLAMRAMERLVIALPPLDDQQGNSWVARWSAVAVISNR